MLNDESVETTSLKKVKNVELKISFKLASTNKKYLGIKWKYICKTSSNWSTNLMQLQPQTWTGKLRKSKKDQDTSRK